MKWLTPFFVFQLILWGLIQGQPRFSEFNKSEQIKQNILVVSIVSKKIAGEKNESWKPQWTYLATSPAHLSDRTVLTELSCHTSDQHRTVHPHTLEARAPPV